MISVLRHTRRRWAAAAVALVAGASLLFAAPAQAYEIPAFEVPTQFQAPSAYVQRAADAAGVVQLWKTAGPATRAAAAAALAGGPQAVQAFVDGGQDAPLAADRKQLVTELTQRGSEHVRSKAKEILASANPALIDAFLASGWESTWRVDLKTVAYYFTEYNNGLVQREAQKSLDEGQQAVEEFVLSGWKVKAQVSDRQATYALIASPNPAVSAGAKTALGTTEPAADAAKVADYLRYGQFVAGDHHNESAAVASLLQQVKADIKANPAGTADVAARAKTAVEQARNTAAAARTADSARLVADRDLLSAHAVPRGALDNVTLVSEKPAKEAFAAAAKELPGLLAVLAAANADPDALIKEARQATLDLALVGTPEVKKAAEKALLAGDPAIKAFIAKGHDEAIVKDSSGVSAFGADRQRVYQLLSLGGSHVNKAADLALGSASHADVRYFLEYGFATAQDLDNRILAYASLDKAGQELRAAATVALEGSRADLRAFAASGQFAAAKRDEGTAAHVASVDAMLTELTGLADKAALDAGIAADAAKAAEAARQAEAARAAEAARQAEAAAAAEQARAKLPLNVPRGNSSELSASAPTVVPWPQAPVPAVALDVTGEAPDGEPVAAERPEATDASVPPAATWPSESATAESLSQEAAAPLAASSTGLGAWTIALIVALVLAAAGAITFLLRRKVPVPATASASASTTSPKATPKP
ncbi:ALF repeat-containing protein [Paenarthrobacter nicotinovorans]|uniref:ALF repeat-containing protein n=1 Tax=Paenarthrobacter nicotinovorans TaxID=29320 RepID=UPI000683E5AA|nr:ALF repeat-containing protein [Paenarthrobacter nicotinovorans]